jgi:hypothetical protein
VPLRDHAFGWKVVVVQHALTGLGSGHSSAPHAALVPAPQTTATATAAATLLPQWCSPLSVTDDCPDESSHLVFRRCERATSVSAIKATRQFKFAQVSSWVRAGWMPQTPDPCDRRISKRSWETAIQDWRNTFKFLYHFVR